MQRFRKPHWMLLLILVLTTGQILGQGIALDAPQRDSTSQQLPNSEERVPDLHDLADSIDLDLSKSPLTTEEQATAEALALRVSSTEWLGALGPVALSPFFGLTCLSGIAILGEERLPEDHYLRRASSPLRHPLVFLSFLVLTILTSIPKFSKVSKPFAQAVDQLETYSAIIILLVIRFMGNVEMGPPGEAEVAVVYQAGIFEFSAETLLMLATVINIVAINTVKFFFEVMIWITPVPFIDAIFEASNKALCAALAAVYAFSPTIATIINLLLLAACLLAFRWVKRREVYYRTVLFDFVRHWWKANPTVPAEGTTVVFPQEEFQGIPALSRCELSKSEQGWQLRVPRLLRSPLVKELTNANVTLKSGLLMSTLEIDEKPFRFGKRGHQQLAEIATRLAANYDGIESPEATGNLAMELA